MAIIKDLGIEGKCHAIATSEADYLNQTQDVIVRHYAEEEDYLAEQTERMEIMLEIEQAQKTYDQTVAKFEQGEATQEDVSEALYALQIVSSKTTQDRHIPGMADDKYTFPLTEELNISEALYALLKTTPEFA